MTFTGGAEVSPTVQVSRFVSPLSLHQESRIAVIATVSKRSNHLEILLDALLLIKQGEDRFVILSPETMKAILKWYEGEDK